MGNETCSLPRIAHHDFQVPQLKPRNYYGQSNAQADERILKTIFSRSHEQKRTSKSNRDHLFQDTKFPLSDKNSLRLSVLYNFQSHRTRIYTLREQTDITSFVQLNIEFSYLTTVFYFFCQKTVKNHLMPMLIENQSTNLYGAYSTDLYCNGEKHNVVIDDRMPTHNDNFLYLRVVKGVELWPLILEKAWCKMIGSYQKAKGLSPEDAFQQITGIPAYTYTIRANNRQVIKSILFNAIRNHYWVALIARNGLSDLQNRQVFYLQSIEQEDYKIISPYVSYAFERYPQKRRGEVIVKQEDIFSHFEHVVVGFHKQNYIPHSIEVRSNAREQLLFQLQVRSKEQVSIRFNQLYNGYFRPQDRNSYRYSPMLIELYKVSNLDGGKQKCEIVDYCQGCNRSLTGVRSAECSVNVMELLQGKYLIRLEVDWLYDAVINYGNLVVYGSKGNITLNRLTNNDILMKEVYPDIFTHHATTEIILHQHNLEVHTFDKEKTTLIEFHNVTKGTLYFQADFSKSRNVLLRGRQVKNSRVYIRLNADEKTIIEVLPKDMTKSIEIDNFEIKKLKFQ